MSPRARPPPPPPGTDALAYFRAIIWHSVIRRSIYGARELTACDHKDVYTDETDFAVAGDRDLTEVAREVVGLEHDDVDEETDE